MNVNFIFVASSVLKEALNLVGNPKSIIFPVYMSVCLSITYKPQINLNPMPIKSKLSGMMHEALHNQASALSQPHFLPLNHFQ